MSKRKQVEARFERVQAVTDYAYDAAYGLVDTVFIGVDHLVQAIKTKALERADRQDGAAVPEGTEASLAYMVECIIKDAEENGQVGRAALMRKQYNAGMYDVSAVHRLYDLINRR